MIYAITVCFELDAADGANIKQLAEEFGSAGFNWVDGCIDYTVTDIEEVEE